MDKKYKKYKKYKKVTLCIDNENISRIENIKDWGMELNVSELVNLSLSMNLNEYEDRIEEILEGVRYRDRRLGNVDEKYLEEVRFEEEFFKKYVNYSFEKKVGLIRERLKRNWNIDFSIGYYLEYKGK